MLSLPYVTELSSDSEFMEDKALGADEESPIKRDMSTQTDMNLMEIEELVILQDKVLNLENKMLRVFRCGQWCRVKWDLMALFLK